MKVPEGFRVTLVASEPEIRQPISISFDRRGRMWVIQYLQYPSPAGLKPIKVDQYLRTTYDRVPEPPPRGPKGADRITICEDTNADGRMDKFKDFITGLNLCSGLALGYDGVFVVQPPYLLFYADKNHDDVPDGAPEVPLTGFGMEDAHAFANSLTWGPDGWLYGAQGSTVTAHVRGIEFQQAIWRYHPLTHAFEVFAEGGGNTWGLDFDDEGEILAGTNYLEKMLHMVQRGYYIKNFGKHGELHNPHAYGYFDHVPYSGYRGLHISIGGIVYHGGAFPSRFNGTYIFANTLDHAVYWADLHRAGSTFTSSFGGTLLKTDDELFRPVDCQVGPDGAVYIADWCDKRASHVDPLDTWDRSNGRIYKIAPIRGKTPEVPHLTTLSHSKLVQCLTYTNDFVVREARQLITERHDPHFYPLLASNVFNSSDSQLQLESFWALYASGGLNDDLIARSLTHSNAPIRKWCVRFLGDRPLTSLKEFCAQLVHLAKTDPDPRVRSQLASSAKRFSGADALPIIRELLLKPDQDDPFIPLLIWWALEDKAISHRSEVVEMFSSADVRLASISRKHILERLGRRYAADADEDNLNACASLLSVSEPNEQDQLLIGMDKGLTGQKISHAPKLLRRWIDDAWATHSNHLPFLCVGTRLGDVRAEKAAMSIIGDEKRPDAERVKLIEILSESAIADLPPTLVALCQNSHSLTVKKMAITALRQFPDLSVGRQLITLHSVGSEETGTAIIDVLSSRSSWAELLVSAVERGAIKTNDVSRDCAAKMASLNNKDLTKRVEQIWGRIGEATPAEKLSFINQAKLILKPSGVVGRVPTADMGSGKKLFQENCGVCHKLYNEGNTIGPDLTGVDRKNIDLLLSNIVNPSAYIRPEYVAYDLETTDDESLTGLMADSTPSAVTLVDRANQHHTIPRSRIKVLRESTKSLMPEGLLENLKPQQLIDLMGYLQAK